MKRTLLFFFFLFTNIFYAQVTFITTCADEPLNLTILNKDFIGNLNPAETTVSYFLSLDDATNNTNVIVNPTQYIGAPGVTNIYGRVNNNGNIITNYFSLTALPPITVTASHTPIICSEETATLTVNASGGIGSYEYSLNGGPYTSNNYFKFLIAGTYKIDVMDGMGVCRVSINHTITAPPRLTATASTVNQNTTIIAEGGTEPYQYSLDGIVYQSSNVFSNLPVGTQPISVRDAKGCSVFTTIAVGDADFPLGSGGMILKNVTCWGSAALRTIGYGGEPPYLYSINGGQSFQTSDTFDNLSAGIYPIAIKDSKNTIINNLSIELLPFVPVTATVTTVNASSCTNNGGINIVANGGQIPLYYSIDGGKTYTSSSTFSDLPAGNYMVLVKDSSECISPAITATIKQDLQLSATALHTELLCAQDKTTLTINATGGEAPYQYAINNSIYSLNNTYNNFSPGAYQIKVKDAIGCITVFEHIVAQPTPINPVFVIDGRTLTINAQGGTTPYQYSVDAISQSMNVFTNLSSGVHFMRVKDSKGCQSFDFPFTIEDPKPVVNVIITKGIDCMSNASIVINATGGKSPYSYSLNGGAYQSSNIFNGLTAGTYFVTVKDVSGSETQVNITVNPYVNMAITTSYKNVTCFGNNDGSIETTVIGGIAPYTYSIGNGHITSNTFSNLSAGHYVVTVKDAANCTITNDVLLLQPSILLLSEVVTNSTTSSSNDGVITVSTTGGISPYSYAITDNSGLPSGHFQASNIFTGLKAGSYGIQVKDANGCIYYKTNITVANNPDLPALLATVNITPITCNNPKAEITVLATGGSGSYVYSIDNGVNYTASNTFSNLSLGNYIITVKDSQNVVISLTATIVPYVPLSTNLVLSKSIDCLSNATINVTASGGKTPYQYSLDNGVTYTTSPIFTNLGAGSYFVRVKDVLNCTVITNSIILEQPVPLTATVASTKIVDCSVNYNSTITITATGGKPPYLYAVNSLNNYQTDNMYFGAAPGTHNVSVKDANGCVFNSTFVVESPSLLTLTSTITEATICGGKSSVSINAIGGQAPYTYSFNGGNSYSPASTSDLSPGGYTVFAKDSNGCIATIYVIVAYPSVPVSTIWTITNTTTYNSNDGSITAAATGGTAPYTYSLLNGNNAVIIPSQTSNTFSNLAPGTYGVIVTDAKGCTSASTLVTITAPSLETLFATATVSQPSCVNPMGIITINATGGTAPYQYSIDNGVTYNLSNTFVVTQPGNYIITVRDAQNDIYSSVIVVRPIDPLFLNATVVSNASCISNGIITAIAVGGQEPYIYSINGSVFQNTNIFTNLSPGVYTVEAKDTNGCIATVNIILTEPEPIFATLTADNKTIIVTAVGGTGNYQYSLDGIIFQSSNIFTVVNYGIYNVFVRDQNGCMVVVATTLNPPSPLIEGKDVITIEFKPGQTLGDLVIDGQNIKWYSNQNPLSGNTTKFTEATLPLTTVLVDGTKYYASQTINGIESIDRLAVTAKLNGSLSTPDIALPNFRFYPNPVHHTLTIDNVAVIDEIEIISVSGKSILNQKVNNTHSEIDLSNVSSGFYFLKVKSEGKTKTIKIVKK
ncbi:hypothetical protein ASF10_01205 [Flavobacterium sp. Leaf82]|uniref:T9SS type A sorting domain-containing protein n=1 Tax=unclassified Flavobacterium TaxID=196869 RepID=UPI000700BD47|nr:T9SS type A sorting domain-containing protein [Flavobacterium sp. Leaf82]KQO34368.1 hypothetical protein ASF10_01205 [Flavobacterium sp. Leaf82]